MERNVQQWLQVAPPEAGSNTGALFPIPVLLSGIRMALSASSGSFSVATSPSPLSPFPVSLQFSLSFSLSLSPSLSPLLLLSLPLSLPISFSLPLSHSLLLSLPLSPTLSYSLSPSLSLSPPPSLFLSQQHLVLDLCLCTVLSLLSAFTWSYCHLPCTLFLSIVLFPFSLSFYLSLSFLSFFLFPLPLLESAFVSVILAI